jgi:hypothetical protein
MGTKPLVRLRNQLAVEPLLRLPGLVARDKQDALALGIKRKADTPDPVIYLEPKLLPV